MEYKNYLQFEGNKVVAFSTLIAFKDDNLPHNLIDAGSLTSEETVGKYYNPVDQQFYSIYNFLTGEYSD